MKSGLCVERHDGCREEEDIDIDDSILDSISPEEIDKMLKEADKVEVHSIRRFSNVGASAGYERNQADHAGAGKAYQHKPEDASEVRIGTTQVRFPSQR